MNQRRSAKEKAGQVGLAMKMEGSIEFSIIEQTDDHVVSEMPIQAGIKNPFGVVHAGAILWLADVTATILLMGPEQASEGMKGFPLAITLNANFIDNQTEGVLRAVSSFVKRGHTVSVVRTLVHGANEKLIADVTVNHVEGRTPRVNGICVPKQSHGPKPCMTATWSP